MSKTKLKPKLIIFVIVIFIFGLLVGAYFFRDVQPRSFLALDRCAGTCYTAKDLAGLLVAVDIIHAGATLPKVVYETDKTVAIESPITSASAPIHYIILPKKDIKNAADLTSDDQVYVDDAYAVMGKLIRDNHLKSYRIITNGPGYQSITYLHFHIEAKN